MEFTINREQLLKLIQPVAAVSDKKKNLAVLANILIVVENSRLSFIGSDLEIELIIMQPLKGDFTPGEVTTPANKLLDICRNLPENSPISFKLVDERLTVKSGSSRFTLSTLPAADFPTIQGGSPKITIELPQNELKQLIYGSQFAMAQQDVRYYLNGMLFEVDAESLRMIATDGHRLAVTHSKDRAITNPQEGFHIIVPRKAISELYRLLQDGDQTLSLELGENHLKITGDGFVFITKLIDGRFPDYKRVLPQGGQYVIELDRDRLKQGLSRAAILSSEKHRGVRLHLEPGWMRIVANNPEQEEAEEVLELDYQGENFEIGFNASYLLDVLNTVPSGMVRMTLQDANCSALIESQEETAPLKSVYVVMPLRL
jgi:DNA polymerase-3 subunit beta